MATQYISNWEDWKELCEEYGIDPYDAQDHGMVINIDEGGGNTRSFEYFGIMPKKEE